MVFGNWVTAVCFITLLITSVVSGLFLACELKKNLDLSEECARLFDLHFKSADIYRKKAAELEREIARLKSENSILRVYAITQGAGGIENDITADRRC